jgi:ferrous iron transport protein A
MATASAAPVPPFAADLPQEDAAGGVRLAALAPGTRAVVVGVADDTPVGRRLADLGFVPGTEVRVVRRAPLGDPVAYELRGTCLCLRRSEADRVRVRTD